MTADRRIFGLDLLRCAAIGGVVIAHGLYFLYPHVPSLPLGGGWAFNLGYLGHGGFYGVELFFVLSGFLIGGILLETGPRLAEGRELLRFYCRRWFRTLPNYWLFLLINILLIVFLYPQAFAWPRMAEYVFFLQNFATNRIFFFPESWSLGIEEWFYLLFPLLVGLVLRCKRNVSFAFLLVGAGLYLASTLGRFMVSPATPAGNWEAIRGIVLLRFDALMTGVLAAWLAWCHPRRFAAAPGICALAGAVVLLCAYVTLFTHGGHNQGLFARTLRFNVVCLGFALLLPLAAGAPATRWPTLNRIVEKISRWSYSMYLVNLSLWRCCGGAPSAPPAPPAFSFFPLNQTSAAQGWLAFGCYLAGTVALSGVLYHCFEYPLTNLRNRFAFSQTHRPSV